MLRLLPNLPSKPYLILIVNKYDDDRNYGIVILVKKLVNCYLKILNNVTIMDQGSPRKFPDPVSLIF